MTTLPSIKRLLEVCERVQDVSATNYGDAYREYQKLANAPKLVRDLLTALVEARAALSDVVAEGHTDLCKGMKPVRPSYTCGCDYAEEAIATLDAKFDFDGGSDE